MNISKADSIDCDAPCANDGGKANKASPEIKIFLLLGVRKSLLTYMGYNEMFSKLLSKIY